MSGFRRILSIAAALLLLGSIPTLAQGGTGGISGTITLGALLDEVIVPPAASGATITIYPAIPNMQSVASVASVAANADGSYQVGGLSPGLYRVQASLGSLSEYYQERFRYIEAPVVHVYDGATTGGIDIEINTTYWGTTYPTPLLRSPLPPSPPSGSITLSGTVYDYTTGLPLSLSALVEVYQEGGVQPLATAWTDIEGRYTAYLNVPGTYLVHANGFSASTTGKFPDPVTVGAGETRAGLDIPLIRMGWITGRLEGVASWQGHTPLPVGTQPILPLHLKLITDDGDAVGFDGWVTADADGAFAVTGFVPGAYRVWVKGEHTLAAAVDTSLKSGGNPFDAGTLREGDADDNNAVTILDFAILAATFGRTSDQPDYDGRADFNDDGAITILDFSLLAANFGQAGAALS